jgi:protein-tyrosine phosphatase
MKLHRLLFVCLGNICRSPAAEGVMRHLVTQEGLADQYVIDSAGTGDWHTGDLPDSRMRSHGAKRGYQLDSRARQVRPEDFTDFDLILVMDRQNLRDIREFAPNAAAMSKVRLFCDYVSGRPETEVPDPYYAGADTFEEVLDLAENGAKGILKALASTSP